MHISTDKPLYYLQDFVSGWQQHVQCSSVSKNLDMTCYYSWVEGFGENASL